MHTKEGNQESEESRVIYTLSPGAKHYTLLVKKKDMEGLNGQSLILFSFIYNTQHAYSLFLQAYSAQENKVDRLPEIEHIFYLIWSSDNLPCAFKMKLKK